MADTPILPFEEFEARREVPFTQSERKRAELLLSDAEAMVREVAGVEITDPPPAVLRLIVFRVASRSFDNPNGISSESIGDASYRLARHAQSGLLLTPEEVDAIKSALEIPLFMSVVTPMGYDTDVIKNIVATGQYGDAKKGQANTWDG